VRTTQKGFVTTLQKKPLIPALTEYSLNESSCQPFLSLKYSFALS
jgi:hypothetical protein